jgi:hypothetical protein
MPRYKGIPYTFQSSEDETAGPATISRTEASRICTRRTRPQSRAYIPGFSAVRCTRDPEHPPSQGCARDHSLSPSNGKCCLRSCLSRSAIAVYNCDSEGSAARSLVRRSSQVKKLKPCEHPDPSLSLSGNSHPGNTFAAGSRRARRLSRARGQPVVERRRSDAGVVAGQHDVSGHRHIQGA